MGEIEDGRTPESKGPMWLMVGAVVVSVLALWGDNLGLTFWPFG